MDIKTPTSRAECLELVKLIHSELDKINAILDEVFPMPVCCN